MQCYIWYYLRNQHRGVSQIKILNKRPSTTIHNINTNDHLPLLDKNIGIHRNYTQTDKYIKQSSFNPNQEKTSNIQESNVPVKHHNLNKKNIRKYRLSRKKIVSKKIW